MYPLVPQALSETRLVLSQHALSSDGDACIMRCEMKLGASRRVLVGSFRSCKACNTTFAGTPVQFLGTCAAKSVRPWDFRLNNEYINRKENTNQLDIQCVIYSLLACSFDSPVQPI